MSDTRIFIDGGLLLLAVFLISRVAKRKYPAPLPPGPKGYPIIGNMLDMPASYPWRTFTEWGTKFGEIVHVSVLDQHIVILNSAKQAVSMLDKKSNIYSDRPILQMGGELVGWKNALAMSPYGHRSREYRRYIHKSMGSKNLVEKHHGLIVEENRKFLKRVLGSANDIGVDIRKSAGTIILKLAYGYTAQEGADPMVILVEKAMETMTPATSPGVWLVDTLPFLRFLPAWFPGAGFKKTAEEMGKLVQDMADVPYEHLKQQLINGENVPPNFVTGCLEKQDPDAEAEHNIKWAAASIYSGGSDTTVSTMHSFILAMALYPDIQKRAQDEIDLIVGNVRLPSFDDRAQLPFVEAIVKEALRWRCVAPLTLPHRVTEDDIHEGYFIPKGTTVFANIWAILHDPETYPNPDAFDPNRFVTETGETTDVPSPYDACFGYGRRICPGMHFADASIFLWCAMILSVYDISKAVGDDGKVVEPAGEYTSSAVSHPVPFKYSIVPRSAKAERLILSGDE